MRSVVTRRHHALDQLDTETPLQLADLHANRRLGEIEAPGSCREARQLDHRLERAELVEIEASHESISFIDIMKSFNLIDGWSSPYLIAAPYRPTSRKLNAGKRLQDKD